MTLDLLRELVELESPTGDADAIARIGARVEQELVALGGQVRRHGPHVEARFPGEDGPRPPLLLLAHMDTVWPLGTLERMPFLVDGEHAHGPGAFDMKAGIVTIVGAIAAAEPLARPVHVLVTADEEVGSPTGRPLVEAAARDCQAALVLEPPLHDHAITTTRSGLARYQLYVEGRSAHAGHAAHGGVSAVEELAHQVLALHALADRERGVRVNVGQVGGGTADNVVPATAWARIDARAWTAEEQRRLEEAIRTLRPRAAEARLRVEGGVTRPPMMQSPEAAAVVRRARAVADELGIALEETASGGGSDGNFAAAAGAPVIDGLGPSGAGAHAVDERVSLRSLAERTRLLAALLRRL